jgi:hypothetical protein
MGYRKVSQFCWRKASFFFGITKPKQAASFKTISITIVVRLQARLRQLKETSLQFIKISL